MSEIKSNFSLTPPPCRANLKAKPLFLAIALSQILLANPIDPSPIIPPDNDPKAIFFQATACPINSNTGKRECTNRAKPYVDITMQGSKKILKFQPSKESELRDKTIVFRNAIDPNPSPYINGLSWDWDYGLGTDIVVGMDEIRYELHAPDSILIFEALDPEKLQPKPKFYRSASIGGGNSSLSLVAKELHIGSGKYNYSDYFSQFDGSNLDKDVTRPFLVLSKMNDAISQSEIRANTFIHKDGALAVESHRENDRFTIDGDLSVLSGGMRVSVGSVLGAIKPMTQKMNRPSLEITGKALIRGAKIVTYITNHSVYGKWEVLSAKGGVTLEGENQVMGVLAYNLGDYASSTDAGTTTAIDNTRIYKDDRNLYQYSLGIENGGKVLCAIPSLKNGLKDIPTLEFVGQAKNKLVEAFIVELEGSNLESYKNARSLLQKYLNDKNVTSEAGITLTGFQAIDKKLKLLENSQYARLVEDLKNKDDLWAVELTSAFFQPKDNALQFEDYFKKQLANGALPDPNPNPNPNPEPNPEPNPNPNPIDPFPNDPNAIVFQADCTNGWQSCTNTASPYVDIKESPSRKALSFKPSADLNNKTIVFRSTIAKNPNNDSAYWEWYDGLNLDLSSDGQTPIYANDYNFYAPNATLVFEALNPEDPSLKPEFYGSPSIGGGEDSLSITAKELHIGRGQYDYPSSFFSDGSNNGPTADVSQAILNLARYGDGRVEIKADTFIHKDGALGIVSFVNDDRFEIKGNLSILGGDIWIAMSRPEINRPILDITGNALIKDAEIMNHIHGNVVYKKWRILGANQGITFGGNNRIVGFITFNLKDYLSTMPEGISPVIFGSDKDLYKYSVKIEKEDGKEVLYAIPALSDKVKNMSTYSLVTRAKNDLAEAFIKSTQEELDKCLAGQNCDVSDPQLYRDIISTLKTYLGKGSQVRGIAPTGFQAIDKKLQLLENNPEYAQIVEYIKNKNDLWAVGITSAFLMSKDNESAIRKYFDDLISGSQFLPTPPDLSGSIPLGPSIPNFPESPSNKLPLPPTTQTSRMIQENLGARLSITQRLSTYAFSKQGASRINLQSPKEQEIQESKNENQTELATTEPATPTQEINSANLLSNLWFNLLGGSNINGSKAGGSFGANVGYDKALENIVLGGYLSYGYLHSQDASSKDLTYSANSHAIEAGMYLRSDFSSHQIDFIFKSQIGISEITDTTEAIETKLTSNHVSSFTQASLSYGYDFSTALIDVKPYVGISAGFAYISKPTGMFSNLDSQSNFSLGASIGLELKKYFSNNGFFYIIPSIEQGMLDTQQDIKIANSSNSFPIDSSLKTYAQILIGGEIELSSSWSLGVSLGVKQNIAGNKDEQGKWKNETYLMGNIGGVWRF